MSIPTERRRVRAARARLARIQAQRDRFATAYAAASSPQDRFNTVAAALRAAMAEKHQADPAEVHRRLDGLTAQMTDLLNELHDAQQQKAETAIRADARRIARNERRRHDHQSHPSAERTGRAGAGAA